LKLLLQNNLGVCRAFKMAAIQALHARMSDQIFLPWLGSVKQCIVVYDATIPSQQEYLTVRHPSP